MWRTRDRRQPDDLSLLADLDGMTADEYARTLLGDEVAEQLIDLCVRAGILRPNSHCPPWRTQLRNASEHAQLLG